MLLVLVEACCDGSVLEEAVWWALLLSAAVGRGGWNCGWSFCKTSRTKGLMLVLVLVLVAVGRGGGGVAHARESTKGLLCVCREVWV